MEITLCGKKLLNPLNYSSRETPRGILPEKRKLVITFEYTITRNCKMFWKIQMCKK